MDLSRPVYYRGLNLNDATAAAGRMPISGRQLDQVSIGAVTGVGYTEKRSQADGRDSSDVYLDGRRFLLSGSVFGESRSEAFDKLQEIRSVFTPTGAFADRPGAYGYLPLAWQEPTLDSRYPLDDVTQLRFRDLYANCRPLATPEVRMDRDRSGGKEGLGAGFQYSVQLEARDPRIYVDPAVTQDLVDNTTSQSGTWENRGDYPSPLKALFVINPHAATTGRITVEAGGSQMLIQVPPSTV